jgi:hypothetical protein
VVDAATAGRGLRWFTGVRFLVCVLLLGKSVSLKSVSRDKRV